MSRDGVEERYSALHRLDSAASRLIRETIWTPEDDIGQQSFITPRYLDALIIRLGIGRRSRVLDVGSGVGGPAVYVAEHAGCRVTGVDLNEVGVEAAHGVARAAGLEWLVDFHHADAMHMPFADGEFTLALSLNVMNVFEDKVGLFTEVRRVLEPGGTWAFISGTFDRLTDEDLDGLTRRGSVPIFVDSIGGYRERLLAAGFVVEEVTEYVADFQVQVSRWAAAYKEHFDAIAEEQGKDAAELHVGYFDTYLRLVEEGKAANHLVIAKAPAASPR